MKFAAFKMSVTITFCALLGPLLTMRSVYVTVLPTATVPEGPVIPIPTSDENVTASALVTFVLFTAFGSGVLDVAEAVSVTVPDVPALMVSTKLNVLFVNGAMVATVHVLMGLPLDVNTAAVPPV